ncbi:uncharacterized protein PHALS_13225 [Plasmopara halstedii]|uniref:Uncharacterized protein n=1 Tax=Plasmopara halstedii TaxID=4781 RepID=A0A0P1API8_PLAHL|nr:uncharacterized protein PHALS_13225 [Plasmopara halstedii]CEG42998.1 hypothetical protein PHALS_13225 [Plasmopara halstedii]|eukprot:XP_024579367.1 hypothetical protein PHALS_13225 [Plasmopara halstedii]
MCRKLRGHQHTKHYIINKKLNVIIFLAIPTTSNISRLQEMIVFMLKTTVFRGRQESLL